MSRPLALTLAFLIAAFPGIAPLAAAQSSRHRQRSTAASSKKPAPQKATAKPALAPDAKVALLGEVAKPGLVDFKPGMTVKQAVELAGGFTNAADTDNVTLRRLGQATLGTLDGKKALAGDQVQNASLRPGDTLYVPRLTDPSKPAFDTDPKRADPKRSDPKDDHEAKETKRAASGDATAPHDAHDRHDAHGTTTGAPVPGDNTGLVPASPSGAATPGVPAAAAPGAVKLGSDAAGGAAPAAPVDPGRLKFVGAVGSPGNYVYEAMDLRPALEGAGGLTKDADPRKIVVKRGVREDGKPAYEIKYDYEQVAKGKMSDVELLPGDVIEVPSHKKGGFLTQVGNGLKRLLPPASVQRQIGPMMGRLLAVAAASKGIPLGSLTGGIPAGTRGIGAPGVASGAGPTALEAALVQAIFAEPPDVRERIIAHVKAQLER